MHQKFMAKPNQMDTSKEDFLHRDRHNRTAAGKKHNALLKNCKIIQNFFDKRKLTNVQSAENGGNTAKRENKGCFCGGYVLEYV